MLSVVIVEVVAASEVLGWFGRVLVGIGISPLAECGPQKRSALPLVREVQGLVKTCPAPSCRRVAAKGFERYDEPLSVISRHRLSPIDWSSDLTWRSPYAVGDGHHLHQDRGGLAASGHRARPVFPAGGGLVDAVTDAHRAAAGCAADGGVAAQAGSATDLAPGSGQPIQ